VRAMRPGAGAPDDGAAGGPDDPLAAAAGLRWSRPDLTAALADHVLETAALADDRDLWLRAAGWAVHARSATGDGRDTAADVIDCLPDWGPESLALAPAHRLRVELALVAVNAGRTDTATALLGPVTTDAVPAPLRADALAVLARCAVEDDPALVESVLERAEQAWGAAGTEHREVGRASTALVSASAHRRAGRSAQAVDRAAAGLARLERRTGSAAAGTRSGYLAAALAAEWLLALLDAGKVDEAQRGCAELVPRLAECRPSRQLARLRLVVARTTAVDSPPADTAQELSRAVLDAAECDAPDLEAVCCSALGTVYEAAGRPDIALTTVERGVAAQRLDRSRDKRFRHALATLPMEVLAIDHGFAGRADRPRRDEPPVRPAADLTRPALRPVEPSDRPDDPASSRNAVLPAGGRRARTGPDRSGAAGDGESRTTRLPAAGAGGEVARGGRPEQPGPAPSRRSRHGLAVDRAWQVGDFAPRTGSARGDGSGPAGGAANGTGGRSTPGTDDDARPDDGSVTWDARWDDGAGSPIGDLLMRSMGSPEPPAGGSAGGDRSSASAADALTRPSTRRTDDPERRVNGADPAGGRRRRPADAAPGDREGGRADRVEREEPTRNGRSRRDGTRRGADRNAATRSAVARRADEGAGADRLGAAAPLGADPLDADRSAADPLDVDLRAADPLGVGQPDADPLGPALLDADRPDVDRRDVDRRDADGSDARSPGRDRTGRDRTSADRSGGLDEEPLRTGERRTAAEELDARRAATGRSEPGLVVADWLAAELADVARIWERISEPPGASVMPVEPVTGSGGCVVAIDIARDGRRQVGRRSAKVVRALAAAIAGRLPAGGRTEQDESCVLSVVLPDLDRAAAEDWMGRTLTAVLAAGSVDLDAAGLQVRAAVRDGDGPAGPQFVRDLGEAGETVAAQDGGRASGGRRRRSEDGSGRPVGKRSAERGPLDPGPGGRTRPDRRPPESGQPTEIIVRDQPGGSPTGPGEAGPFGSDPLGIDGRGARRSRSERPDAGSGAPAGSDAVESRHGRRRARSDADETAAPTERAGEPGPEPPAGAKHGVGRSGGATPIRARRDLDALDSYRADGDGPDRFPADRFGSKRPAPGADDGPEPGRRRSRRSEPAVDEADRSDSHRSGRSAAGEGGTAEPGPVDVLGIDPLGARPEGDDDPLGGAAAPRPEDRPRGRQGTGRRRADRVPARRPDQDGSDRDGPEGDGGLRDRAGSPDDPHGAVPPRHAGTDQPGSTDAGAPTADPESADQDRRPRSGRSRRRIDASTEGLGLADLLAGALAEYRGI
jgi:hypothetical protein